MDLGAGFRAASVSFEADPGPTAQGSSASAMTVSAYASAGASLRIVSGLRFSVGLGMGAPLRSASATDDGAVVSGVNGVELSETLDCRSACDVSLALPSFSRSRLPRPGGLQRKARGAALVEHRGGPRRSGDCSWFGGLRMSRSPPEAVDHPTSIVGTGTLESCTEQALAAAIDRGGRHRLSVRAHRRATLTVSSEKLVLRDTVIDGGGLVTLSGA